MQALSSQAVVVDGSTLVTGATIALRVTGPGYDASLPSGAGTLPPITTDGSFTVASSASNAVFGTFDIEDGAVVHATGALTIAESGIGFDLSQLATVKVPTDSLTTPASLGSYRLGDLSSPFSGSPTFHLPDATYAIMSADQVHVLGTFTVSGRAVTSTTGAVVPGINGIAFDKTRLATVTVATGALSTPANLVVARIGNDTNSYSGNLTISLPDGSFVITNSAGDRVFGGFGVTNKVVTSPTGAVALGGSNAVAFDTTKLARASIDGSALSSPRPGLQVFRLTNIAQSFSGPATFRLPPGSYPLDDATGQRHYGTFAVTGTDLASPTGALTIPSPGTIGFATASLAKITVPIQAFSSANFIIAKLPGATNTFGGAPPGISPTFFLPDGHYELTSDLGTHSWGDFDVSARAVTATHGALKPDTTTGLAADACKLGHVTFGWNSSNAPPYTLVDTTTSIFPGPGQNLFLPIGTYTFGPSSTYPPGAYHFTINATGPATNVVLPLPVCGGPAGFSNCIFFTESAPTCKSPPIATCVGTSISPVDLPGECQVNVDNTNRLAGSCTDGGSGLLSCTFDGATIDTLGPGTHDVSVVATGGDGSRATCTSHVRVAACVSAPAVHCVGTSASPQIVATAPATCGVTANATNALAGTCTAGSNALASCTFDGESAETLGPGNYAIVVRGVDVNGLSSTCTSYLTVVDREPPAIACEPTKLECQGPLTTASGRAVCTDNCGVCSTGCGTASLPVGTGSLACTAGDPSGNEASCAAPIEIVDTTAPAVTLEVSPTVLWPPDHMMWPIAVRTTAEDVCDPAPVVTCSASSSERPLALGSGHTPADIAWIDGTLYLRAERSGLDGVSGRTYTVSCSARDATGNVQTATAQVVVPHDEPLP